MTSTYQPTGTGHCKRCGRDVGAHDGGHRYVPGQGLTFHSCQRCGLDIEHPLHDVGRVLTCPSDWTKIIGAMPDFPLPEVRDD